MSYPSLTERFLQVVERKPNSRAMLYKEGDAWHAISSAEMLARVAALARDLRGRGVGEGDRVAIFAPNCPEWHIADFAALGLGAVTVPIYFNESPERIVYILNDSGARVLLLAGKMQCERVEGCRARFTSVEHIVKLSVREPLTSPHAAEIEEYRRSARAMRPDQLATLIYTSGTTGEPKGVMLTHANLSSNDIDATGDFHFELGDVGLSFLPLSHVYERMIDYGYLFNGVTLAYVERPEQVQAALVEVRPTILAAVPRVFEKVYAGVVERGLRLSGTQRKIFDWAMRVALEAAPWRAYGQSVGLDIKIQWAIADALVYKKVRAGVGGRLRSCSAGAAPLRKELIEFFFTIGIPIYQGYGLTETSPVVSTNRQGENKIGTVGRPIRNVEVRIADDGEILVRGPCVMRGYFNKPDETRAALTADGWLHTGDIGHLDADGYLTITDRKKDLLKTAAGKFVAPQPIENALKTSPLITNAVVIGDRRRFVSAIIVPNFAALEAEARAAGVAIGGPAEACMDPWVHERMEAEIARLTSHLAQYESIKRFALLDHDFTFDGGELTYTMKLRRRVIEQRYAELIESLYVGEPVISD